MARYQPYAYHKRQPVYMPRPFDPVDTARYEAEERAWYAESFSWYRPFPSIQAWYANGCRPQRGPDGWIMTSPKWQPQGNPTSPIYSNPSSEEERGSAMYSPTACSMSPLSLGPSCKPYAPPPQGSVLLETIAKGRSMVFECGVGAQEAKGVAVDEGKEEEEDHATFVTRCAAAAVAANSALVGVSMWGERYPFGSPNAPEPPWAKDPSWPLGKAAAAPKPDPEPVNTEEKEEEPIEWFWEGVGYAICKYKAGADMGKELDDARQEAKDGKCDPEWARGIAGVVEGDMSHVAYYDCRSPKYLAAAEEAYDAEQAAEAE